jgi:hypothetical protein
MRGFSSLGSIWKAFRVYLMKRSRKKSIFISDNKFSDIDS